MTVLIVAAVVAVVAGVLAVTVAEALTRPERAPDGSRPAPPDLLPFTS